MALCYMVLQYVTGYGSMLHGITVCYMVWQYVTGYDMYNIGYLMEIYFVSDWVSDTLRDAKKH